MWLVINRTDNTVFATNRTADPSGSYDPALFRVVEWAGPEPPLHDPHNLDNPVESYDPTLADLATAKTNALAIIQRQAEAARGRHITLLPGKIGEYTQKREAYLRWVSAGSPAAPNPADYPIAAAEAPEYGYTIAEMLAVWGARAAGWDLASAIIAATERRALIAVQAATSPQDVQAILEALAWS